MGVDASLEQALEYCLQELTETGDVEASLRRYPQYVDELRPQLQLAQATRVLYRRVPSAPGGLKAGRQRMLAAAAEERKRGIAPASSAAAAPPARRWYLAPLRVFSLALTVALAVIILGGGFAWAGSESLPGDLLYPVKLTTEEVRLALASSPAERVELALGFAEERVGEAQALVAERRPVSDELDGQIQDHVELALTYASTAKDVQTQPLLAQISTQTRAQMQVLERIRANAPDRDQLRLEHAAAMCRRGAEAAEDGLQDPQRFRQRQQHRLADEPLNLEPEPEPGPKQEQQQPETESEPRDQHQPATATPTAVREPETTVTPKSQKVTAVPSATRQTRQATATRQEKLQGPEVTATPEQPTATETPHEPPGPKASPNPQGPQATSTPEALPEGPEATATPRGSQVTATPHATSQGPGTTDPPQGTPTGSQTEPSQSGSTAQPEPPGGGNGGK